jgi:hypothetical protein
MIVIFDGFFFCDLSFFILDPLVSVITFKQRNLL